jgi:hypothetical protein
MDSSDNLSHAWAAYWAKHSNLAEWHAATYQRRAMVATAESLAEHGMDVDSNTLDPEYTQVEFPTTGSQLLVSAKIRPSGTGRLVNLELLFAAIARQTFVAAVSFGTEGNDGDQEQREAPHIVTFRALLCNDEVGSVIAEALSSSIPFKLEPAPFPITTGTLLLRGAGLVDVLRLVGAPAVKSLFDVFGPCELEVSKGSHAELQAHQSKLSAAEQAASLAVTVTYTDTALAEVDAAAALRTLQLWLAYDWALILTFAACTVPSELSAHPDASRKRLRDMGPPQRSATSTPQPSASEELPVVRRKQRVVPAA